ncbi:ImmA/IrrE family metallo-endopeptidase [bacterium]|nr:MAG: ImmA/IrrE family metallo-endopeptidase [bacterium]
MNGDRLRQARELRGHTQTRLAQEAGITQPAIAQFESGGVQPSSEVAEALASALQVPLGFLDVGPKRLPEGSLGLQRALARTKAGHLAAARARAAVAYELADLLRSRIRRPPVRVPRLEAADPENAAAITRSALGLSPDEPIKNLTRSLERAGVIVFVLGLEPPEQDSEDIVGFSAWIGDPATPCIFVDSRTTAFRRRATIAHELGHLVLDHQAPKGRVADLEDEAWDFARCLLLPPDVVRDELGDVPDLGTLARIKGRWGVSMSFVVKQVERLGILSRGQVDRLKVRVKLKFGSEEPGDAVTTPETPLLLKRMAELHYGQNYQADVIARETSLPSDIVASVLDSDHVSDKVRRLFERSKLSGDDW